ncbi:chromosome segregation protein SMC [Secundilactobacillus oryzae]|uniref:chromosome segregation protein SMC n=1 Tax=Secundilactobacillus oryzae TaxID=1202668 RepID=UPI0025AEF3F9|nr:chromosome segregation protein SMC [Secundilactobacillus oryzae]
MFARFNRHCGTNGSGKSNISEAIRWVLGEQSAKSLRGSKMPEVIFAGSADRKPLNRAQVKITFDNTDHYLNSDFETITVTRKLFRSGESEYLINDQTVRLKDILELFMDSGMGQDSFSIISQGRVESIFNSKPEERRSIIEEVAGVFKYKKHKEKAERELQDTNEYLDRINDILRELNSQIAPLEEQSSLAKDYLDQKSRFEAYDQQRLVYEINQSQATKADLEKQRVEAQATVGSFNEKLTAIKAKISDLNQTDTRLASEKDRLQSELLSATRNYESLVGQKAIVEERTEHLVATRQALQEQIAALGQEAQTIETQASATDAAIAKQQTELDTLKASLAANDKSGFEKQIRTLEAKIDDLQNAYVDLMQQKASLHNEQQYLQKNRQSVDQRLKRIEENLTEAMSAAERYAAEQTKVATQLTQIEQTLSAQQDTYQQQTQAEADISEKGNHLQQQWLAALEIYQKAQARLNSLRNVSTDYSGFYQGVRSVLKNRKQFDGLIGPVSDILNIEPRYMTAVEYALGNQVQQVIVRDEGVAKQIIGYLSQNHLGRATFLPLSSIKTYHVTNDTLTQAQQVDGFIGVGSELVKVAPEYQVVMDHLLGTTLICDNLTHATTMAKVIGHRNRIVTLDGDVISASGAISGGKNKQARSSILAQNQELADLEKNVGQMSKKLAEQEVYLKELKAQHEDIQAKLSQLNTAINETKNTKRDLVDQQSLIESRFSEYQKQVKAYTFEKTQQSEGLSTEEQLKQNEATVKQIETQLENNQAEITQLKADLAEKRSLSDKVANDFQAVHEEMAIATEKLQQLQRSRQAKANQLEQTQATQTEKQAELTRLNQGGTGADPVKIAAEIERSAELKQQLQEQITVGQAQFELNKQQLADQNATLEQTQQLAQLANDDAQKIETKLARVDTVTEQQMDKLAETYHVSYADVADNELDTPIETVLSQLKLLKRGLDEIGEVNVGAIEEFKRVKERHDFLTKQQDDLVTSKDQLLATMDKMDVEVQKRFKESFDLVAAQFSKTFVQMFGGGQAKLILTEPEHLLTTGIDIMAQPPGKKFQNMRLLSGGERSLTAITLLFAILNVKPIPFCILDEAESALDPANVDRFANYLSHFDGETQFIVITHRKETMVYADSLYGVTMQESGISKMVSVNLDELVS